MSENRTPEHIGRVALEIARHAERAGIGHGRITIQGHAERSDGDLGPFVQYEKTAADWIECLDGHASAGNLQNHEMLRGVEWDEPNGGFSVMVGGDGHRDMGKSFTAYDVQPVMRSVRKTVDLTKSDRRDLDDGATEPRDLLAVRKAEDELEPQIAKLESDFLEAQTLLVGKVGAVSSMRRIEFSRSYGGEGARLEVAHTECWLFRAAFTTAVPAGVPTEHFVELFGDDACFESLPLRFLPTPSGEGALPLVDPERLAAVAKVAGRVPGADWRQLAAHCRRAGLIERTEEQQARRWLIEGLIPSGILALIVAEGGAGKSTGMHELAVCIASEPTEGEAPAEFLGYPVNPAARGLVIFATLEEGLDPFEERELCLDPCGSARNRLVPWFCESKSQMRTDVLDEYGHLTQENGAPRLLIIDSASKFREGSEIVDSDVNAFLDPLESFARKTGCTVIVIHHLNKGSGRYGKVPLRTAEDLKQRVSGHPAWINRPRVVIGMIRDQRDPGVTRIGVIKQNEPALAAIEGTMKPYRRDAATMRHVPIDEPLPASRGPGASRQAGRPARATPDPERDAVAVLEALADCHANGQKVTKTGQASLFAMRVSGLAHMTRNRLEGATQSLIESNRVTSGPEGLRIKETNAPMSGTPA